MLHNTSIETLLTNMNLEIDLNKVTIANFIYKGVLEKPKAELIQWLYKVLHTGNIEVNKNQIIKSLNDLDSNIIKRLKDPEIKMPVQKQEVHNKSYPIIHGVRIHEDVGIDQFISVPCFRPNLTPGFFMFVNTENGLHNGNVKRHYIYADTPEYGIETWVNCVEKLMSEKASFSAKVLSSSANYPRNDALVFYSSKDTQKVQEILVNEINKNPIRNIKGSLLAKKLVHNLYVADEPIQRQGMHQSFGEHRCNAIADAIQDHFITGVEFKLLLKQRLLS
ncbi:TPA: hypothetical protein R1928_002423, partial [Staphylococcus delphini]|nr:hypothetical protein [Staphylococcus delphini]HEC2229553.1 hypothetical protein [Staphylococcus delphini]